MRIGNGIQNKKSPETESFTLMFKYRKKENETVLPVHGHADLNLNLSFLLYLCIFWEKKQLKLLENTARKSKLNNNK